ncbi:hypothetical protein FJZ31_19625 [Candidatus Poribacteria bacterium]|nr:hypothetical protein [Candidatus Poribacteria bacterium]
MNIKQHIPQNLRDFKSISVTYSTVVAKQKDDTTFAANSGSDFISAIEFIFIPILILLGVVVALYRWRIRTSRKYRQQSERLESTMTSENQSAPTPQVERRETPRIGVESQLHQDELREMPRIGDEYDLEFQPLEAIALNEIKRARRFRERGQISEYCTAISWAIKKYVGEKYHIKIVGASTSQILDSLPQELTDSVFDYVGEILRTCDMMGLAQHRPSRGELDHLYQIAAAFIQRQIQPRDTEGETAKESDERNEE